MMIKERFINDGYAIIASHLDSERLRSMQRECDRLQSADSKSRAGIRDPLARSELFAETEKLLRPTAIKLIGNNAEPVRSILFDKTPESNWDVVWHQDVTIAVKEKKEVAGFGPWSTKIGVPHVQPTALVLEQMVTLRLHLDDCPKENGALHVVPGSHLRGFTDIKTLDTRACDQAGVVCEAACGEIIVMRPLILHASKKSLAPGHRRVLHIEYAAYPLPGGLAWA